MKKSAGREEDFREREGEEEAIMIFKIQGKIF